MPAMSARARRALACCPTRPSPITGRRQPPARHQAGEAGNARRDPAATRASSTCENPASAAARASDCEVLENADFRLGQAAAGRPMILPSRSASHPRHRRRHHRADCRQDRLRDGGPHGAAHMRVFANGDPRLDAMRSAAERMWRLPRKGEVVTANGVSDLRTVCPHCGARVKAPCNESRARNLPEPITRQPLKTTVRVQMTSFCVPNPKPETQNQCRRTCTTRYRGHRPRHATAGGARGIACRMLRRQR